MKKILPKEKLKSYSIDEYGVKNYNSFYLLIITLMVLYGIIALLAIPLVHFESLAQHANITTYKDAFWALQMSASTIGFGDFYPVTQEGRFIIALMFYIGVGMVGFIGAQFVNKFVGFSDTNIKNRELRKQNAQILKSNQRLEKKVERLLDHFEILIEEEEKLLQEEQEKLQH